MYSDKDKIEIRNYEREAFRTLKKLENKEKKIPSSKDILYMNDFILEEFESDGDSGKLYLATNKYNHAEKYILKHEYYDCACNEFMYSKIGNKMGIKIAPVKLFILNDLEDKFKSDFVCGIKYLENCEHISLKKLEQEKDKIKNWQDYFKMLCLECLFEESDGIEVVKYNNEIYRLDMTASFKISDFYIHPLAYNYKYNGINIREFATKNIMDGSMQRTEYRIHRWKSDIKYFTNNYDKKYLKDYMETFELFLNVSEKNIEEWVNILTIIYPNVIGDYFKQYFKNLKLDVEQLLKLKEKELLAI